MRSLRTTTKSSPRSLQLEKACAQQRRPNTAKNKKQTNKLINFFKKENKTNERSTFSHTYANKADHWPPALVWNDEGCTSVPALVGRTLLLVTTITTILLYNSLSHKIHCEWKNVACHISKQRMLQPSSHHIRATPKGSPEGTQDTNRMPAIKPLQPPRNSAPRGDSGWENTGFWPRIAEVHIKGMISTSPDFCIFPYIEKC